MAEPSRIVIVGAGLAGCVLAARLADYFKVTIVDLSGQNTALALPVRDIGAPARVMPHAGSGPGGTTHFWQNGLSARRIWTSITPRHSFYFQAPAVKLSRASFSI
jgi:flavin-dependent dehydrogenase